MFVVVLLHVRIGHVRLRCILRFVEGARTNVALHRQSVMQGLHDIFWNDGRSQHTVGERLTGQVTTNLHHKLLVRGSAATQELFIASGHKFAIFLEGGRRFNHSHSISFTDVDVVLLHSLFDSHLIGELINDGLTTFFVIEHRGFEAIPQRIAEFFELLTLLLVKHLWRNRYFTDFGNGVVSLSHTVIAIDPRYDETRNNQHHGDKHQPALMCSKCVKHGLP